MNTKKKTLISTVSVLTIITLIAFTFVNTNNAYAENNDASVVNTGSQSIATTRKAPVSITIYSDVVTESADTYDYLNNTTTATTGPEYQLLGTAPMQTYAPNTLPIETAISTTQPSQESAAPQSTAAPGATEEPDIITYPPTVAPEYTDF